MMQEIWKDVIGYEGLYKISNFGKIYSLTKKKELKQQVSYNGYLWSILTSKSKARNGKRIHRLVAEAFIPNFNNTLCINHKDSNRKNNHIDNLEMCNIQDNTRYRKKLTKKTSSMYKGVSFNKRLKKWQSLIGNRGRIHLGYFNNEKDAAIAYNNKAIELFGNFALLNDV